MRVPICSLFAEEKCSAHNVLFRSINHVSMHIKFDVWTIKCMLLSGKKMYVCRTTLCDLFCYYLFLLVNDTTLFGNKTVRSSSRNHFSHPTLILR